MTLKVFVAISYYIDEQFHLFISLAVALGLFYYAIELRKKQSPSRKPTG